MTRQLASIVFATLAALILAACGESPLGPAAPSAPEPMASGPVVFSAHDFAWSSSPGGGAIEGALTYRAASGRFSCRGGDVILTPETAWTRRRMIILYGSSIRAAQPLEIVRARTPSAPSGDYASYVRKTTCDDQNRFSFKGLPDGAWFVITLARPENGGEAVAVMRRVETHGAVAALNLG